MSMKELVDAGAPELPEGYFYRVGRAAWPLTDYIRVSIRKSRRIGSSEQISRAVYLSNYATILDAVAATAQSAFNEWCAGLEAEDDIRKARALFGDHDPKGGKR